MVRLSVSHDERRTLTIGVISLPPHSSSQKLKENQPDKKRERAAKSSANYEPDAPCEVLERIKASAAQHLRCVDTDPDELDFLSYVWLDAFELDVDEADPQSLWVTAWISGGLVGAHPRRACWPNRHSLVEILRHEFWFDKVYSASPCPISTHWSLMQDRP
jgi:hypothetical protein